MARTRNYYMILDTETATLPCADLIANGNADIKKRIAIARPLAYDFGYVITDRLGNIVKKVSYLVAEIFWNMEIFNTAYYAEKRPLYYEAIQKGEAEVKSWDDIMTEFTADLETVKALGCFNSMFDLKKAIPFTELYIRKMYSKDFSNWKDLQYKLCRKIAETKYSKDSDKEFDREHFTFRGKSYDCFDVWGMACNHLLDTNKYRDNCIANGLLTNSGEWFSSSAESAYKYLIDNYHFAEAHTALEDAIIECAIFSRIARQHRVEMGITYFPFRALGTTHEYVLNKKNPKYEQITVVLNRMTEYLVGAGESRYAVHIENVISRLEVWQERCA